MKKNRNYRQGLFKPAFPLKYKGNVHNIVYRSSYELVAFRFFDSNPNVIEWCSEETIVPYMNPCTGRISRYFVDIYAKMKTKTGEVKKYLIEIKPYSQTIAPTAVKKTKHFITRQAEYAKNQAKWQAAAEFCKKKDMTFVILTEKNLGI